MIRKIQIGQIYYDDAFGVLVLVLGQNFWDGEVRWKVNTGKFVCIARGETLRELTYVGEI